MEDPIVEEIRKIREEHAARFDYDLQAIVEDLKKSEKQFEQEGWKVVSFAPKRVTRKVAEHSRKAHR